MSLLDDAKALVAKTPYIGHSNCGATVCGFCNEEVGMYWQEDGPSHESDCPWLAMPRMVAALEAAQALVDATDCIASGSVDPSGTQCLACDADMEAEGNRHAASCPWQALVAALRGAGD